MEAKHYIIVKSLTFWPPAGPSSSDISVVQLADLVTAASPT